MRRGLSHLGGIVNPFIRLAIGCTLIGIGVVFNLGAQKDLMARFAKENCEDCDDEKEEFSLDEEIKSFVDEAKSVNEADSDHG